MERVGECRVRVRVEALAVMLAVAAFAATVSGGEKMNVAIPSGGDILASLRKEHPRVMATAKDFERVRKSSAGAGAAWYAGVK